MRAFQSKQDTRSMFWLYAGENALTVVAALALYPVAGVKGLAGAWIGSYTVALPFAWHRLRKSAPITWSAGWLTRVLAATGVMAAAVYGLLEIIPERHSIGLSAGASHPRLRGRRRCVPGPGQGPWGRRAERVARQVPRLGALSRSHE